MIEPTFNLRLIEAVRHSRCLFDNTDRQYRNTEYKNRVWQRLVTVLGFDGDPRMLSARWKQLRDKYGKEKRKQKYGNEKSSWQYFKHLHFLDPHMTDRAEISPSRKEPTGVHEKIAEPCFGKNLILEVRRHPCLYDVRDPKYRHGDCRTQAWGMIIDKLRYPGTVPSIYKQWKKHRDRYVREKRRLRNLGDPNVQDVSTWEMYDDMAWIDQHLDEQQLSRCARSLKRGGNNDGGNQDEMSDYGDYDDDINYVMMAEKRPNNGDVLLDGDSAFSASIVSDLRTLGEEARIIAKQQIMILLESAKPPSTPAPNYL
ncbi:Alcohol dehydrogenase transcription factor myb/sant-like protein [Caenorhabditis elegans]|uniref:Alcohol dehydrogenase transcription factor myb/sant-like protein n=1 Tax=Caenorhabditis elegans TaxID=6239 RepID=Q9N5M0_CAEEL|nr:Alcohol dehydrogenase transcription factor myb/sant-like protein [Caenorhabditis elegans]CCD61678.1 Alcohol dehydrogenase transcription factor myb/sant-like protein [Caenorhabditis elegans]|eukprot:NP_494766.1 MADF domain transcription factor [Caenorhabditis elegans]